jgi:serine/threonine-protein kinase
MPANTTDTARAAQDEESIDSFLRAVADAGSVAPSGRPTRVLELRPGLVVAKRYRLDRLLAVGGMGTVWAATHNVTRRAVALKFLKYSTQLHPDARRRFAREARATSAVLHENVVEIVDVLELDDETPVIVMELLQGETLAERLRRVGRLSLAETAQIMLPVVDAVRAAHAAGVVHRDLKPGNIFLVSAPSPRVKVLDFGVAKLLLEGGVGEESSLATMAGTLLGTPCYMAPEQALADASLDQGVDIWALGVTLYECLAGARPVRAGSVGQVVFQLMGRGIEPLENLAPWLPSALCSVIMDMLERERGARLRDLGVLHAVLSERAAETGARSAEACAQPTPIPPPRKRATGTWLGLGLLAALLSLGLLPRMGVPGLTADAAPRVGMRAQPERRVAASAIAVLHAPVTEGTPSAPAPALITDPQASARPAHALPSAAQGVPGAARDSVAETSRPASARSPSGTHAARSRNRRPSTAEASAGASEGAPSFRGGLVEQAPF